MILLSTNLQKTLVLTSVAALACAAISFSIQSTANEVAGSCSYLDPITIDIVALIAGLFLLIEGSVDIFAHREHKVRSQLGRTFRICLGISIITIHVMQFIHK